MSEYRVFYRFYTISLHTVLKQSVYNTCTVGYFKGKVQGSTTLTPPEPKKLKKKKYIIYLFNCIKHVFCCKHFVLTFFTTFFLFSYTLSALRYILQVNDNN